MRDLVFFVALLGVLVGVSCGTVRAAVSGSQTSSRSDLAQYRAESPNYSIEYLDENNPAPDTQDVRGETDVELKEQAQQNPAPTATELPATNPPYLIYGAVAAALVVAAAVYVSLRKP